MMNPIQRTTDNGQLTLLKVVTRTALFLFVLASAVHAQDAVERDLLRVRPEDESLPWLVMNTGGHTASVQGLAFAPDGKRLYSAGLDKVANVWDVTSAVRALRRTFLLERTLRWQIGRGLRGAINALAVASNDGLVAIGGYGATGGLGEILLIDPVQNRLIKTLHGHSQTVASLSFSHDGQWLASVDVEGRALLWKRGEWTSTVLSKTDREVYGDEQAAIIKKHPKLRPLTMPLVGNDTYVVLPSFQGVDDQGRLQWKLRKQQLSNPEQVETLGPIHFGLVTALATSADGRQFASADSFGALHLWQTGPQVTSQALNPERMVLSLAFTPDGKTLVAGTAATGQPAKSQVQLWDLAARQIRARQELSAHVFACAVSSDGKYLAHGGGANHEVYVGRLDAFPESTTLRGQGRRVVKAAFTNQAGYTIGFGTSLTEPAFNNYGPVQRSFNPVTLDLSGEAAAPDNFRTVEATLGEWAIARRTDGLLQLSRNGQPAGVMPLDRRIEGSARCYCWLTDEAGKPIAVAVGTDTQNSIYVYGLADQGECPIWRHLRGHHDLLSSVGVSTDGKYLVSGSTDGTVRLWSLAEIAKGPTLTSRWGAEFAVDNGVLKVTSAESAGPLFFNGVRTGDTLNLIKWHDGKQIHTLDNAADILARLKDLSWATQVHFEFARGEKPLSPFQRLPAWQPLATLFVGATDEWAMFTPEGYYDASANGHTLFGWHVNRGLDKLPDFYRADQFRRRLERPELMERLLEGGSVAEAFKLAALGAPAPADEAVQSQVAATPRIEILSPTAGTNVDTRSATVRARIEFPQERQLTDARVFANGVAAPGQRVVEEQQVDGKRIVTYEWQARLATELRHLIQVLASTDELAVGASSVLVEQPANPEPLKREPKLYLLAVGMNDYRDPAVQPLSYSVADAESIVQLFEARTSKFYQVDKPTILLNEQVTPAKWRETFTQLRERLSDAQPDDLLVIFLAGHGFVDPISSGYYFAGYNITREDYQRGIFASSIAWSDFQLLADIPCRKLAMLDTCHSGAIQPLRSRNLKAAVRTFHQDLILTLTASAGHEKSEEKAEWAHGAFTKTLLEGLEGQADASADGLVSLEELADHVKRHVPQLTGGRQNPTAGPIDLLPYVSLRLTSAK